jgi:heme exporter protein C
MNWHQLFSPKYFYRFSEKILPLLWVLCLALLTYGLIGGLYLAPPDYQQKEAYRILYVHVPAAFLSLGIYSFLFLQSVIFLIWRIKIADVLAASSAGIGASFTLIALVTGAIWGKPMWGTYWVWDARLTSELILLFLYFGYIGLRSAVTDVNKAAKLSGILAIIGMVDIPIVHFSVNWWNTLHQGPSLSKFEKPDIAPEMLFPLIAMILCFSVFYLIILMMRSQKEILMRERHTEWVKDLSTA